MHLGLGPDQSNLPEENCDFQNGKCLHDLSSSPEIVGNRTAMSNDITRQQGLQSQHTDQHDLGKTAQHPDRCPSPKGVNSIQLSM